MMKQLFDSRGLDLKIIETHTASEHDGGVSKTACSAKNGKFYLEVLEQNGGMALFELEQSELQSVLAEIEELKSA
jgi:hypothetical protein